MATLLTPPQAVADSSTAVPTAYTNLSDMISVRIYDSNSWATQITCNSYKVDSGSKSASR